MQQRDLIRKFDLCLSCVLHNDLHLLGVPERINYKLNVSVHRCLQEKASRYLVDCCKPVSEVAGRRQVRSASRQHITVPPRYRLSTFGRLLAFSVASPTSWNSLPDRIRDSFMKLLKRWNYLRVI